MLRYTTLSVLKLQVLVVEATPQGMFSVPHKLSKPYRRISPFNFTGHVAEDGTSNILHNEDAWADSFNVMTKMKLRMNKRIIQGC